MDDLVRWLGAQLDEDERIARAASGRNWLPADGWLINEDMHLCEVDDAPTLEHIAVHDPARVLREIDAKRRIVQALESAEVAVRNTEPGKEPHELMTGAVNSLRAAVRMLAAVYADRPGFREEWRP